MELQIADLCRHFRFQVSGTLNRASAGRLYPLNILFMGSAGGCVLETAENDFVLIVWHGIIVVGLV
jgi:hypothetical protein